MYLDALLRNEKKTVCMAITAKMSYRLNGSFFAFSLNVALLSPKGGGAMRNLDIS